MNDKPHYVTTSCNTIDTVAITPHAKEKQAIAFHSDKRIQNTHTNSPRSSLQPEIKKEVSLNSQVAKWRIQCLKNIDHIKQKTKKISTYGVPQNPDASPKVLRALITCLPGHKELNQNQQIKISDRKCQSTLLSPKDNQISIPDLLNNIVKTEVMIKKSNQDIVNTIGLLKNMKTRIPLPPPKFMLSATQQSSPAQIKKRIPYKRSFQYNSEMIIKERLFSRNNTISPLRNTMNSINMFIGAKVSLSKKDVIEIRRSKAKLRNLNEKPAEWNTFHLNSNNLITFYKGELNKDNENDFVTTMQRNNIGDMKKLLLKSIKPPEVMRNTMTMNRFQSKSLAV